MSVPPREPWSRWARWRRRARGAWRDLVPVVALALAAYAVFGIEVDVERQEQIRRLEQQNRRVEQQGRRVAIEVLCGGIAGVQRAGRMILLDELPGTPGATRPKGPAERRERNAYASAYVEAITITLLAVAGVEGVALTDRNGILDCERLRVAARAPADPGG